MSHIKQFIAHCVDAFFSDASDNPRTMVTGFIASFIGALYVPDLSNIVHFASLVALGIVGGFSSMVGKEVYSYIKVIVTKNKTSNEKDT